MKTQQSPYMTMAEAAVYLRYTGPRAADVARQTIRRCGVPVYRRGGKALLVRPEDLDEMLATGRCDGGMDRRVREMRRK